MPCEQPFDFNQRAVEMSSTLVKGMVAVFCGSVEGATFGWVG
jgi:hypothetical protein